jgi:hypothetical protein
MKRLNQWHRVDGGHLVQTLRVFGGLEPPPETKEERAERKAAEKEAKAERAAIQAVEAEAEQARRVARLAEWRTEAGPPEPPQNPTGFYSCQNMGGAYFPVGAGPWPDYRPPGLAWDRAWNQPKPPDVPWADEVPPPKVFAADPKPIREAVGKAIQGRMFE